MSDLTVRQIVEGMSLVFDREAAPDLEATIQFDVSGAEPGRYYLQIADGECRFHLGEANEASLTIETPSDVWSAISAGELDGRKALMNGQYNAIGDLNLLSQLPNLFDRGAGARYRQSSNPPGPVQISGMLWLAVAFVPWIVFWITFDLNVSKLVSVGFPLFLFILILVYRSRFGGATWMEMGSAVFFAFGLGLSTTGSVWFAEWGNIIGALWKSGLWLGSLVWRVNPLSAEYSKWNFIPVMWRNTMFLHTNAIITLMWGFQFLISALLGLSALLVPSASVPATTLRFVIIWPAFIFTKKRQAIASSIRIEDPEGDFRRFRVLAWTGLAVIAATTAWMAL